MNVPESFNGSLAFQFLTSRGWNWRHSNAPNIELEKCPYCNKDFHLRMEIHGSTDEQKNRDGLHLCMRCSKSGTLSSLKQYLGVTIPGVESTKEKAGWEKKIEPLPELEACHQALLENEEALDYLMNGRGFSREIIEQQKLGYVPKRYFRETGEVPAIVYPYLVNGNIVFAHYRTLPTMPLAENRVPKAFSSPSGWDVPLYNGGVLHEGLSEVIMVEGEANCIAAMDHGVTDICGVPGANFKKAEWIETLDKIGIERVYICYDKDKVGQKAAQALAARIGVERCWKIVLPEFHVTTDTGETRLGKDLNEYFSQGGGTAESFAALKEHADLFDVDGVAGSGDAVQELYDEIVGKGSVEPRYKTPWPSVNKFVGFNEGDIIYLLAPEKTGKTTIGLNLMEHMVSTYGEDGIIICLEMTRSMLARKWVCHLTQIEDNIPHTPDEAQSLLDKFLTAIPAVQTMAAERAGNLYFCQPKYTSVDDIMKLVRDVIRRYGVKWIMFDNLHLLADETIKNPSERPTHLSRISKMFARIGKEFGVQMLVILQPHRVTGGRVISTDNVDGSAQIAKDCDVMMTAWRKKIGEDMTSDQVEAGGLMEQDVSFSDEMLLTVGLSRYSSGGRTKLRYVGATSSVFEMTEAQVAKVELARKVAVMLEQSPADALRQVVAMQGASSPEVEQEILV